MKKFSHTLGFTLVEVLVATSIILVFLLGLVGVVNTYVKSSLANVNTISAGYLAEEGIEAMKYIRDRSWNTYIAPLAATSTYYLVYQNGWVATTTPSVIDSTFTRTVAISSVSRDNSTSDIVTSGGTTDINTKKITVTVTWFEHNATSTRSVSTYLTNLNAD